MTTDSMELMRQLQASMNEELHSDLVPYLEDGALGKQLRHPLVYLVPMWDNGRANAYYQQKVKDSQEALAQGKYQKFVYLHERPYRLDAFIEVADRLTDTEYWKLLGSIWTDTENQWQNLDKWSELLDSDRPSKNYLMDEEEDQFLRSLPDTVTIYRGCQKELNQKGLSWTLKRDKAKFFANRLGKRGIVLQRTISREQIVALFMGRNEWEVVWKQS
jgi:hypothetical protein